MSAARLNVLIVDDEPEYREKLARQLRDRTVNCTPIAPPEDPRPEAIVAHRPDAVLVDYQLTQRPKNSLNAPASYLGSLLIAAIRERLHATPVILLTRRKLGSGSPADTELDEAFDDLLYKEDIELNIAGLRNELRSLAAGYQLLSSGKGAWQDVLKALRSPDYAADDLRRVGPAGGWQGSRAFRPSSIARWVRRELLQFPGVLVDQLVAATELGISLASFRKGAVQKWFSPAAYGGVFAAEYPRWWRGSLHARANAILSPDGEDAFPAAWNRSHPTERVTRAKCCVCNKPTNESVCALLHQPVMVRCSLPFYPDRRPAGFDIARASARGIRETDQWSYDMFPASVLPVLQRFEDDEH